MPDWPTVVTRMKEATLGMGGENWSVRSIITPMSTFPIKRAGVIMATVAFSGYLALQAKMTERDILDVRGGFNRDFYGTEIGLPDLMANDVYNVQTGQLYLHKK